MTEIKKIAKLEIEAVTEKWGKVRFFLTDFIKSVIDLEKEYNNILIACEEIFVNISKYAYQEKKRGGKVFLNAAYFTDKTDKKVFEVTFKDNGKKFNPTKILENKNDVNNLKIGGQGLVLVKKIMNKMEYQYVSGSNVLKLTKNLE